MFAGIDVAAERHVLARLDHDGMPMGRPLAFVEDAAGYRTMLERDGFSTLLKNPTLDA